MPAVHTIRQLDPAQKWLGSGTLTIDRASGRLSVGFNVVASVDQSVAACLHLRCAIAISRRKEDEHNADPISSRLASIGGVRKFA